MIAFFFAIPISRMMPIRAMIVNSVLVRRRAIRAPTSYIAFDYALSHEGRSFSCRER
jgi:hypothetical protein